MDGKPNRIIVAASERSKYVGDIISAGLEAVFCLPNQPSLFKVKDKSSNILLILVDESAEEIKKLVRHLTVLCIDGEKNLFVYGRKDLVDIVKKKVPKLYVVSTGFLFVDLFPKILKDINDFIVKTEKQKKPSVLFVHTDEEYVKRIKPYLINDVDVFSITKGDGYDIASRVKYCDSVVISTTLKLPVVAFTTLFAEILKKRAKDPKFAMYFITPNNEEQNVMNVLEQSSFIAISMDREVKMTAAFLIKRMGK